MLFQFLAGSGSQAKKRKRLLAVWVKVSWLVIPYPVKDRFLTCLGQRQVKLYTLFRTARPKNHTLSTGTSLYSPNEGVPPQDSCQSNEHSLCKSPPPPSKESGGRGGEGRGGGSCTQTNQALPRMPLIITFPGETSMWP